MCGRLSVKCASFCAIMCGYLIADNLLCDNINYIYMCNVKFLLQYSFLLMLLNGYFACVCVSPKCVSVCVYSCGVWCSVNLSLGKVKMIRFSPRSVFILLLCATVVDNENDSAHESLTTVTNTNTLIVWNFVVKLTTFFFRRIKTY